MTWYLLAGKLPLLGKKVTLWLGEGYVSDWSCIEKSFYVAQWFWGAQ